MFDVSHHSRKGRTISAIDQFLDSNLERDLSDNDVYKACVEKELKGVLRERKVSYFAKRIGCH